MAKDEPGVGHKAASRVRVPVVRRFRTLLVAFCLTVVMAGGAAAASALWSQSSTVTMDVTAGTVPSPELQCSKVSNETAVLVTWAPQGAGVTGYDVTVTRNGQTMKSASYAATVTSEKVSVPLLGVGDYAYTVTVTATHGSWKAEPSSWGTIRASVVVLGLGLLSSIACT